MTSRSLIDDLSTLTTIPATNLNQLVQKSVYCICDDIEEAVLGQHNMAEIDLGIGKLYVHIQDKLVQYKFIPNQALDSAVKDTIINHKNPLTDVAEETLVHRILNTYKSFI